MCFKKGDKVKFLPGPKSSAEVVAEVTREPFTTGAGRGGGTFIETKDAAGRVRKVRPGACQAA